MPLAQLPPRPPTIEVDTLNTTPRLDLSSLGVEIVDLSINLDYARNQICDSLISRGWSAEQAAIGWRALALALGNPSNPSEIKSISEKEDSTDSAFDATFLNCDYGRALEDLGFDSDLRLKAINKMAEIFLEQFAYKIKSQFRVLHKAGLDQDDAAKIAEQKAIEWATKFPDVAQVRLENHRSLATPKISESQATESPTNSSCGCGGSSFEVLFKNMDVPIQFHVDPRTSMPSGLRTFGFLPDTHNFPLGANLDVSIPKRIDRQSELLVRALSKEGFTQAQGQEVWRALLDFLSDSDIYNNTDFPELGPDIGVTQNSLFRTLRQLGFDETESYLVLSRVTNVIEDGAVSNFHSIEVKKFDDFIALPNRGPLTEKVTDQFGIDAAKAVAANLLNHPLIYKVVMREMATEGIQMDSIAERHAQRDAASPWLELDIYYRGFAKPKTIVLETNNRR